MWAEALSIMTVGRSDEEVDRISASRRRDGTLAQMDRHATELEELDVEGNDQQSGLGLRFLDAVGQVFERIRVKANRSRRTCICRTKRVRRAARRCRRLMACSSSITPRTDSPLA